ncbi:MAG: hypothetical protein ACYCYE_04610 [Clostridia bacterium]
MIKKAAAFYSIFIGISVMGMWCMILLSGSIPEGPIEMSFHLFSEFLMATLMLVGGIGLLKNHLYGRKVFMISNGMLVYSILNAAGYYGQRSDLIMAGMFTAFFIISSVFLMLGLVRQDLI